MTQGSDMIFNRREIGAVEARGFVYNNKKGQQDQQQNKREKDKDFRAVYDVALSKAHPEDDINIQTNGYTKTGAPSMLSLHKRDYTFQTKTC